MAFTISHAVLAPLISKLTGCYLPIAALAIGCMAPDLYRLFTADHYFEPHQWSGIFKFTLWLGLFFCLIWYGLYRPVIYRILGLQDQIILDSPQKSISFIIFNIIAVLLGICTHLIWDGLTHVDFRTFAFHDFLSQKIDLFGHIYPMHLILQISSSVVGLAGVIWLSWQYYKKNQQHLAVAKRVTYWGFAIILVSLSIGLFSFLDYIRHIPTQYFKTGLYHITGRSINEFSQSFLISLTLGCILFLFLDRGRRLG